MSDTTPPLAKTTKETADEVLSLVEQSTVEHILRFFGMAGQTITKQHAENILSKIGMRIMLRNGTLSTSSVLVK